MTRRVWWDAAGLAVVALAAVAGLATGPVGAAKPDPAPTGCAPTEFNGGVCVRGRLVFPTDGAGDLPGQSPADLCAPGSGASVLCDRNGRLATTDGPPPSTPPSTSPRPAPSPKPSPRPSRAKPNPSLLPSGACAHPEDFNPPMSREYLKRLGLC